MTSCLYPGKRMPSLLRSSESRKCEVSIFIQQITLQILVITDNETDSRENEALSAPSFAYKEARMNQVY